MANTKYDVIYKKFERQVVDYDLQDLIQQSKAEVKLELLQEAIVEYFACPIDLSDRDDTLLEFNNKLTDLQMQVLSNYMVFSWTKPYLNNQDLFESNFATSEYKAFSPAMRMKELRTNAEFALKEAGVLATKQSVKEVMGGLK